MTVRILQILSLCWTLAACGPQAGDSIVAPQEDASGFAGPKLIADFSAGNPMSSVVLVGRVGDMSGMCGGLLISADTVLTARHCADTTAKELRVFFPQKDSPASTSTGFFSRTKNIAVRSIIHADAKSIFAGTTVNVDSRDYNTGVDILDISILKLSESASDKASIYNWQNLATDEDLRTGDLVAYGWDSGEIESNGRDYKNLVRKEDRQITVASTSLMESFFASELTRYCAIRPKGLEDCPNDTLVRKLYGLSTRSYKILTTTPSLVCQGDSGSPLFVRTTSGQYKLVGVTSSALGISHRQIERKLVGIVECSPHTFYQTVAPLANWLKQNIR